MKQGTKRWIMIATAVVLNIIAVYFVIASVVLSISQFDESSFDQNVENIKTLTDSSADKMDLLISQHTEAVLAAAGYVTHYQGVSMTALEATAYFAEYYSHRATEWQLVDNEISGTRGASDEAFHGMLLSDPEGPGLTYTVNYYPALAVVFHAANEDTLGTCRYVNEFTDVVSLQKSFAITCPVRLRVEGGEPVYKTLMMVVQSSNVNHIISSNNNIDSLDFFGYSNAIIDSEGDYVFSSESFPGTNFLQYISTYDETMTKDAKAELLQRLKTGRVDEPVFYKNNRGKDCIYTVAAIQNTGWYVLSMVPIDSFHNVDNYSATYFRFFRAFMMLFVIDIVFVLIINRQLRRKTKEARAASVAKSQFLSSMSHDIRTPMNAIIGMTVIADEALAEPQPDAETLKDCVQTIRLSGNHLLTLINDILDISKIENGKLALSPDDFSISETMGKMLEIVQPQIKEKQLSFHTHIVGVEHEFVHADELRINQIYINILSNAIKYTPPGGRITVDLTETPIPGKSSSARFVYRVSDTGIGMDPEFVKTIFDRFSRAVDTRVNSIQGTGLGMSISKQLVDLMGGDITVQSQLNVGSTFTVTLELPVADMRVEDISLAGHSALMIDDDEVLLETGKMVLTQAGMAVDTVAEGAAGLAMARGRREEGRPYDVVLVDWRMPRMSGLEVLRALRAELGESVRIMVMTAYSIADIEREARGAGANALMTKPLFKSKLLHGVQALFAAQPDKPEKAAPTHFHLRVLVAEDNNVNWKVLSKLLLRYDIKADRAEDGRRAVELARQNEYDLILMDIQMPVMNGYEATGQIRRLPDPQKAGVPIYAMTADAFMEDVTRCIETGMNGHLAKPIEIDKLLKVLSQLEEQRRS